MDELKVLYESLGFENILTYIQSGNVIFTTKNKDISSLKATIEEAIMKYYKFHVPVEIRTKNEWQYTIKNNPLSPINLEQNGTKVLVTFLSDKPTSKTISNLLSYVKSPEKLLHDGKDIFLYCPNGYGKSKLSNNFIENKLNMEATTRNWKSVLKIEELLSQ